MIGEQKTHVERLAALAEAKSMQIARHKRVLRRWRQQTLRKAPTLVWLFAAGALVGARRGARNEKDEGDVERRKNSKSSSLKSALGVVNASLLTWRYLNKPISSDSER